MPEQHPEIERTYAAVAAVPCSSENEVDYHCICFVRSDQDECLYELDGDSNGPVCLGPVNVGEDGDILRPETIARIRKYIDVEKGGNTGCSLMALVDHGMILASLEAL